MLQSPENFHLTSNVFKRGLDKLSRGQFGKFIENIRVWRNTPKEYLPDFYVNWADKQFDRIALVNALIHRTLEPKDSKYLELNLITYT